MYFNGVKSGRSGNIAHTRLIIALFEEDFERSIKNKPSHLLFFPLFSFFNGHLWNIYAVK
jgi:hypothetical protein